MRFCAKCGYVMDEFDSCRDQQNCPGCGWIWLEDDMTALKYADLSERKKDAYDKRLLKWIKRNQYFNESLYKFYGNTTEDGGFWTGFRIDKLAEFECKKDKIKPLLELRKGNIPFKPFPEIDWEKAHQHAVEAEHEYMELVFEEYYKSLEERENVPRCPICQSTKLAKISTGRKILEGGFGGIWGMDIMGKTYECRNCGSKF